jgi:hypothetical protein
MSTMYVTCAMSVLGERIYFSAIIRSIVAMNLPAATSKTVNGAVKLATAAQS